jgi:hypothetical protein
VAAVPVDQPSTSRPQNAWPEGTGICPATARHSGLRAAGPVRWASQQARLGEICMKHMTDFTAELDQSGEDIYEVFDEAFC